MTLRYRGDPHGTPDDRELRQRIEGQGVSCSRIFRTWSPGDLVDDDCEVVLFTTRADQAKTARLRGQETTIEDGW